MSREHQQNAASGCLVRQLYSGQGQGPLQRKQQKFPEKLKKAFFDLQKYGIVMFKCFFLRELSIQS